MPACFRFRTTYRFCARFPHFSMEEWRKESGMNRLFALITIVWIVFPLSALAQDVPRVEVFAGFPHLQGENSGQIFAAQGTVTYSPLKWFSLVGDGGIQFGE